MFSFARGFSAIPAFLAAVMWTGGCAGPPQVDSVPLHYLIAGGEQDIKNIYSSVVQVDVPGHGTCSGVLAGPHLVLTAAHCFCFPAPALLRAGRTYSLAETIDENEVGLRCRQAAHISTVQYFSRDAASHFGADSRTSFTVPESLPQAVPFAGPVQVHIHEGYKFQTNARGEVVKSQMDLAAVYLGGEFEGIKPGGSIPDRETRAAELLIAAGYGPTHERDAGARYYGIAKVLDLESPVSADKVFAFGRTEVPFRNVYALKGDSGGPCFREDPDGRRWIIGIMSHGAELKGSPVTFFTSTFHHREWIHLQHALSEKFAKTR